MVEHEFKDLHRELINMAKGLSEAIEMMEKRYHRRGRNRPIDVNIPAGSSLARPGPFGGSPTSGPYKPSLWEAYD